jgi:hypothetical protein
VVASRSRLIHVPGFSVPVFSKIVGTVLGDVLLTRDEYHAMANGLADTEGPATGTTSLNEWLLEHGPTLGLSYANELERHFALGVANSTR